MGLENFTEAERHLYKAKKSGKHNDLRQCLGFFVAKHIQALQTAQERSKQATGFLNPEGSLSLKYATLYENARHLQGKELDAIDYIALSLLHRHGLNDRKVIEFGEQALEQDWPSSKNPLFQIQITPNFLKRIMALAHYQLKQFGMMRKLYSQIPRQEFETDDYKAIACMFGMQQQWQMSFKYFQDIPKENGFIIQEEEAIVLMDMLMEQSQDDFNRYGRGFIALLERSIPPLQENIGRLRGHFKQKKKEETRRLIRQAVAQQHFEKMGDTYQTFDEQYQNLWAHSSLLPADISNTYLNSFNELAHQIEEGYSLLTILKAEGGYADRIGDIRELSRSLEKNVGLFSAQVKEFNHEIAKVRRQLYIERLQSTSSKQEAFQEFIPSSFLDSQTLKAQLLSEQKNREAAAQSKAKAAQSQQEARTKQRAGLTKAYQDKTQQTTTTTTTTIGRAVSAGPIHPTRLCSFRDKTLKHQWEQEKEELDQNVLEMLNAIDRANSIFQLRTYLTPGTALEILQGDRKGQISLRYNDQYRLCFYWVSGEGAYGIELVDYHR